VKAEELLIDLDSTLDLNVVGDPVKEQKALEIIENYYDPV